MVACAITTALLGIDAVEVRVEAQVFGSLRKFSLIGLPDSALRESKERVRCAIKNSGFNFPRREVVVSLAPASLPKFGAGFDLPIALSIIAADGQLDPMLLKSHLVLGELALDGSLKPVAGILSAALLARNSNLQTILVPTANAPEAAYLSELNVFGVGSLRETISFLRQEYPFKRAVPQQRDAPATSKLQLSIGEVIGQHAAKRALLISAAGGHNLLMVGPPGSGKSMLAQRLGCLLPPLAHDEAIDILRIYSSIPLPQTPQSSIILTTNRPFRSPHHTTSTAGLIGGGAPPQPGEISLAHKGILFLDELPEFRRDCLESLREPLESKQVLISRAKLRLAFPADFILVAAMNPCPCGKRGLAGASCECSPAHLQRYRNRLSAPLLDRIDLQTWVPAVSVKDLTRTTTAEDPTNSYRELVQRSRKIQQERFGSSETLNASMKPREVKAICKIDIKGAQILESAAQKINLSARGYHRVLKVARTIADLAGADLISEMHLSEALSYRLPGDTSAISLS